MRRTKNGLALFLAILLGFMGLFAALPFLIPSGYLFLMTELLLMLTMAQMWNLLAGYAGLLSLGPQMFVAMGAYTLFWLSNALNLNPFFVLPASFVVGGLLAAAVAPFMFRLRDAYFSIGMWVLAEIALLIVSKTASLGGMVGLTLRTVAGMDQNWFPIYTYGVAATLAMAAVVGLYALMRTRLGLGLMAVRDNDVAAASVGVHVMRNRLIAFVLSSAGCALAGAVHYMGGLFINPVSSFDPNWAVSMMFIVVIGGIGTIEGPILGTLLFFLLRELCTNALDLTGGWYLVILGLVAMLVMRFAPKGLWGTLQARFGWQGLSIRRVVT